MRLYVSRLEWARPPEAEPFWRAPGGDSFGMIDLRSLPQCARAGGTPEGFAIVAYDGPRSYPWLLVDLGEDVDGSLRAALRDGVSRFAGVGLTATTPGGIIRELLLAHGDPTGQARWKPLRISRRHGCRAILGKQWLFQERFSPSHPAWTNTVAVFRADYRRNRVWLDYLSGAEHEWGLNVLRRWTGSEMRKLWGRMGDDLLGILPAEYAGDGWRTPATVYTESFNQVDSGTLGPDQAWVEFWRTNLQTVSNQVYIENAAVNAARVDSALSTDDHYTQMVYKSNGGSFSRVMGPLCRQNGADAATDRDFYAFSADPRNGNVILDKYVDGVLTNLGSAAYTLVADDLFRLECDASAQDGLVNGTSKVTGTDTAISGNLYGGIYAFTSAVAGNLIAFDDFEEGDLGAVTARLRALRGVGA